MIRLLARLKRKPEPRLLGDSEMADLYEEIFDEPVSAEALFAKFGAVPKDRRHLHEWVMDLRTLRRIRLAHAPTGPYVALPAANSPHDRLLGLPVVVEAGAKLSLRERVS